MTKQIGLRIDVDTWRGTRLGVPRLCDILSQRKLFGTFFFSVGPDNMGRHLWRLCRPAFLLKMLRSNAPGLYGWDILLRGTFWPGPLIGPGNEAVLKRAARDGHEIGIHAWDHYAWQTHIEKQSQQQISEGLRKAWKVIQDATGQSPICAASPSWRTTPKVLLAREEFKFHFNSDCRGTSIFYPMVDEKVLSTPQIPNTLPTYDEVIGVNGITNENYNEFLKDQLRPGELNVLTIHAEAEGITLAEMFENFLDDAMKQGWEIVPLGKLLLREAADIPTGEICKEVITGREGWVSMQKS
jgi:undecaprenyl phosphate-alpha-L-ara4FN deformylase